jgi:hypothetical protein
MSRELYVVHAKACSHVMRSLSIGGVLSNADLWNVRFEFYQLRASATETARDALHGQS